jgi:cellulose synthase/poly-beta-1,6-N-acetylglucosamine synthase-like glycosyltransferase
VLQGLTIALELLVVLGLLWFSARRLLLLVAALRPARPISAAGATELPSLTLAVAAHNEEHVAHRLVTAIAGLDYPRDRFSIVLVCDGCTDGTPALFGRWAGSREHVRVLELRQRVGKGQALNEALAVARGEIFVVLDADLLPRPDFLLRLVGAFCDRRVGAAAGLLHPTNAASSLVSRYSTASSWAHQLITSAGKDRLDLDPTTLGAGGYRRVALRDVGGFQGDSLGEDVDAALALAEAGWTTRFVRSAVVDNTVVERLAEYWHQQVRWARAALGTATRRRWRSRSGGVLRRLETWTAGFDYADRVALLGLLGLVGFGKLPLWLPALYFAVPAFAAVTALLKAGAGRELPIFVLAMAVMFLVDVGASAVALLLNVARRPQTWRSGRQAPPTGASVGSDGLS